MIITKSEPLTLAEIEQTQEEHEAYIKAVIDLKKKICSSGAAQHRDSYEMLAKNGSQHSDTWGGGIISNTKEITYTSMINIRPNEGNISNAIENSEIKQQFTELLKYFFQKIL
ncbi:MAG: DUF5674 family protein [Patescibacteria group bacterium]